MKLSVIMSVHNNEDTISEAIASVLNQTFGDFEFIVVDDGSTDNSGKIIKQFQKKDSRIIMLIQENNGLTKSLNKALGMARGEYIARQDADDISLPERFENQINFLEKNRKIGFTGCSCEIIDQDGDFINFTYLNNNPRKNAYILAKRNIFCHGSMMFRRELLSTVSGYREFFKYAQDYDLYLRLIEITLPGSVNKILYRRRICAESISVQKLKLQSLYSDLAKKCYKKRSLKKQDTPLLREALLEKHKYLKSNNNGNLILYFIKSLHYIKHNRINEARGVIGPNLLPFHIRKLKLYLLWLFSYFPLSARTAILKVKTSFRKWASRNE